MACQSSRCSTILQVRNGSILSFCLPWALFAGFFQTHNPIPHAYHHHPEESSPDYEDIFGDQREERGFDPNQLVPSAEMFHHNHLPDFNDNPESQALHGNYPRGSGGPSGSSGGAGRGENPPTKSYQEMDSLPLGELISKYKVYTLV